MTKKPQRNHLETTRELLKYHLSDEGQEQDITNTKVESIINDCQIVY